MKHLLCGALLAAALAVPVRAGENPLQDLLAARTPPKTLASVVDDVPALAKKVSFDLQGVTIATVVEWLREAGVGIVIPTSAMPKADDPAPATYIVNVKDMPLGQVAELVLNAAGFRHTVQTTGEKGAMAAMVAITPPPDAPGRFQPMMGMNRGPQMGGPGRPGGRQRGGNNNAANPNAPAAPNDAF